MPDFTPLNDILLVKHVEQQQATKGGILLVDNSATQVTKQVEVIARGPGTYKDGVFVEVKRNVGDLLLVSKNAGVPVQLDGETYLLIREGEAYGVFG